MFIAIDNIEYSSLKAYLIKTYIATVHKKSTGKVNDLALKQVKVKVSWRSSEAGCVKGKFYHIFTQY